MKKIKHILLSALSILTVIVSTNVLASQLVGNIDDAYQAERVTIALNGKLYAWDSKGNLLSNWPVDLSSQHRGFIFEPRLVDLDGDSRSEILAVSKGEDGSLRLHVYNGLAQELTKWSHDINAGGGALTATPIISDINADNELETIFATSDLKIHILGANGETIVNLPSNSQSKIRLTSADLENKGQPKLFSTAGDTIYVGLDPSVFFVTESGAEVVGEPVTYDVDGDSFRELIFSTTQNRIYIVDHNGTIKKSIPVSGDVPLLTQVSVGDVDLDGNPEILAILSDGTRVAYRSDGSSLNKWLKEVEYRQFHEPSVGKIVNDLYNGAFNSSTGWDLYTVYMSSLQGFAIFSFGQNVHEFDRRIPFYFAQAVDISDVAVRPLVFTPNADGVNDVTELHYNLSQPALVSVDLFDSNRNFISSVIKDENGTKGDQIKNWDGIDHKGTRTVNDDKVLEPGVYILKITAVSKEGLISTAETQAILFGIKAKIEFPSDISPNDDDYPTVWGVIAISGVAADPNIGENQSGFDYNSYKLYYRSGASHPTEEEVASVGQAGSAWLPLIVPLRLQSPTNLRNEPNDSTYPNSNVGVSSVQHGVLGSFDTTRISNGVYTILLKVIDGDLNGTHRQSYDHVILNINQSGTSYNGGNGGGNGGDPDGSGGDTGNIKLSPKIENVNPLNSVITEWSRQANISYTLKIKPSDINVTIYQAGGNVVYTQSFLNRAADRTYTFSWNGLDNLGKQQPNGSYSARITATAVDGFGQDQNDSASIQVNVNDAASEELNIIHFAGSVGEFNPLDVSSDLPVRSTAFTYALNKTARTTIEIYDESGRLQNRLLTNYLAQTNGDAPTVWDGTDFNGLILPFGKYFGKLTSVGTEVGREETVTAAIPIILSSPGQNSSITAVIGKLIGDGKSGATNDQERGILVNNDNPDDDYPLEGNPDFYWNATGNGNILLDLEYDIGGWGQEQYTYALPPIQHSQMVEFYEHVCCATIQKVYCIPFKEMSGTINEPNGFNDFDFILTDYQPPFTLDIYVYRSNGSLYAHYATSDQGLIIGHFSFTGCPDCNRIDYTFARRGDQLSCSDWSPLPEPPSRVVGRFSTALYTTQTDTRSWPQPEGTRTNTGWISRYNLSSGVQSLGSFPAGSIGTHSGGFTPISQNFSYSVRELLNNEYRQGACSGGKEQVPFGEVWMGSSGGPDTGDCVSHSPNIFANVKQGSFSTNQDTTLANGKIQGLFANFNEDDYHIISEPIVIYDHYAAKNNHPDLYTFSNIVRISDWNIDLKYPNGDPVDAFQVVDKTIHGGSSLDTDANGIPDLNDNTLDYFKLKLKPNAVPKRFVEIRGNVSTTNYQLKYYSARLKAWQDIPKQLSPVHGDGTQTLGWWDVTQLNGENYTVLLSVKNTNGDVNEDTFNVGIGKRVDQGEVTTVKDAFGRTKLQFGTQTLRDGSTPNLVSATPVPNNDPLLPPLNLPTGTVPVGPVYNLQPDGISIDPAHPVQMEITYTCEEVWNAFGSNPAEISVYNLKENGQLETISTINPPADTCETPDPNQFFRITAMLEHFSSYIMLKEAKDIPNISITSPVINGFYKNPVHITGNISGPELELLKMSYVAVDDIFANKIEFFEGASNSFDFDWESNLPSGEYTIVVEALNVAGLYNTIDILIKLDADPPLTKIMLDGVAIPDGQSALAEETSVISFTAEDYVDFSSSAAASIEYKIDDGPYLQYLAPFTMEGRGIGNHEITYVSYDTVGNREPDRKVYIIIRGDDIPAGDTEVKTQLIVNGSSYENGQMTWVSGSSSFTIGAVQNSNQLDGIYYRLAGGEFVRYSSPVSLAGFEEGVYSIEYYGTDIYGKSEKTQILEFVVDRTPPKIGFMFNGHYQRDGDNYLINKDTRISLSAVDNGNLPSGTKKYEYRFGDGDWQTYSEPILVDPSESMWLEVRSIDNVDNLETSQKINFQFDDESPQLKLISVDGAFSPNADGVKDSMNIVLNVSDDFSKTLYYTFNVDGQTIFRTISLEEERTISWNGMQNGTLFSEGIHLYEIYVEDEAGNRSASISGEVILDTTPPQIQLTGDGSYIAGSGGLLVNYTVNENLCSKDVKIDFVVTAGASELSSVSDMVMLPPNEKVLTWSGQGGLNNIIPNGSYSFKMSAQDVAGNKSQTVEGNVLFDATQPLTQLLFEGGSFNDWISHSTNIVLKSYDLGLGVASTFYRLNQIGVVIDYTAPFTIKDSGAHELYYYSTDNAGNKEIEKLVTLQVDSLSPQTNLVWDGIAKLIDGSVHISGTKTKLVLNAIDEHSGLSKILFQIDNLGVMTYSSPFTLQDFGYGWHTVKYWAIDNVGNTEKEHEQRFYLHDRPSDISITVGNPNYSNKDILYIAAKTPIQVVAHNVVPNISSVEYQIDSQSVVTFKLASPQTFSTPAFYVTENGAHTINYKVTDDFENSKSDSVTLTVDSIPPETLIERNQRSSIEASLVTPLTRFTLTASDTSSGVSLTEYAIDGSAWQTYVGPFDMNGLSDGDHTISYRSRDNTDNVEKTKEQNVHVVSTDVSLSPSPLPRVLVYQLSSIDLLKEIFDSESWHYKIVTTTNDFIQAMRSDEFDFFVVSAGGSEYEFEGLQIIDKLFRELTERIHNGNVLIIAGNGDIKGVAWDNMISHFGRVGTEALEGDIDIKSTVAVMDVTSLNLPVKMFSYSGNITPLITGNDKTVVGTQTYGKGKLLRIGMDLDGLSGRLDEEDYSIAKKFVSDLFKYLKPNEENLSPSEVLGLGVMINSKEKAIHCGITASVPGNVVTVDSLLGVNNGSEINWLIGIAPQSVKMVDYVMRLPFAGDNVKFTADVLANWNNDITYPLTVSYELKLGKPWYQLWDDAVSLLEDMASDETLPDGARVLINAIIGRFNAEKSNLDEMESKIDLILDTIWKLSVIQEDRTEGLHYLLDETLEGIEIVSATASGNLLPLFSEDVVDNDGDGLSDEIEVTAELDPFDADSDDDGVLDGMEKGALIDSDSDGLINALDPDSDDDGIYDGIEMGITEPVQDPDGYGPLKGTGISEGNLFMDTDPSTTTDPTKTDTDGGGLADNQEDRNLNGKYELELGETDPNNPGDDTNPTFALGGGGGSGGGCTLICDDRGSNGKSYLLFGLILPILVFFRMKWKLTLSLIFLFCLISSSIVYASDTGLSGFNIQSFRLTSDSSGVFSLYGSETLGHLNPAFRLDFQDSGSLINAGNPVNNQKTDLIKNLLTMDVMAGMGVSDFINVGVNVPVNLYEKGISVNQETFQTSSLGDISFEGKIRLLKNRPKLFGGALLVRVTAPTGKMAKFTGDDGPTLEFKAITDKQWNDFYATINFGYRLIKKHQVYNISTGVPWDITNDDRITFGFGAKYILPWQSKSWSVAVQLTGETVLDNIQRVTTPLEFIVGGRKEIKHGLSIELGAGKGLTNAIGSPSFRVFTGLGYDFSGFQRRTQNIVPCNVPEEKTSVPELFHVVYFLFNQSDMTPKKQLLLNNAIQTLKQKMPKKILIEGYADLWGEESYNEDLSMKRAMTVKDFMIKKGISEGVIETRYYGSTMPVHNEMTLEGQKKNRMVEVRIIK